MADDPQRRLESLMRKLSQAVSPREKKPRFSSDWIGRQKTEPGPRVSTSSIGSGAQCRPWDRGDLMRRLATFKAMTWFGKPKAISPVNCASRGWINVEMDVICCEACGARLLFATPSSWDLQQVEKAAAVFSLKLDNGHKLLCPWIDNLCDEKLAFFPPTPPPALVDSYKERSAILLRLRALPVISSSAIDYMKSPQLEHFLSQSLNPSVTLNNGIRLADNPISKNLTCAPEDATANLYYQAQKIISLCGWEPCLLPYAVDGKDGPSESSGEILGELRSSFIMCRSDPDEVEGRDNNHTFLGENQYDPSSVALDCRLCGARVGLWAFATVEHPLEYFTLIADLLNGQGTKCMDVVSSLEASKADSFIEDHQNIGSLSKGRPLGLNLTIAGGPPPTKQNFRPVVSFPIVSRHLRAEFASSSCTKDHLSSELSCENHENSQFDQQKDVDGSLAASLEDAGSLKRKRDENKFPVSEDNDVNNPSCSTKEFQVLGNGGADNNVNSGEIMHRTAGDSCRTNINSEGSEGGILQTEREITDNFEARESVCLTSNANLISRDAKADENNSGPDLGENFNPHESSSNLDLSDTGGTSKHNHVSLDIAFCPDTNATQPTGNDVDTGRGDGSSNLKNVQNGKTNYQTTKGLETTPPMSDRKEKAGYGLGNNPVPSFHRKICEFNPIRQHRPFCPWVAPEDGENLPGWRLTLNALIQHEKVYSDPVQIDSPTNLIDEADDPVVSIRKLFMSPPTKRLKGTR